MALSCIDREILVENREIFYTPLAFNAPAEVTPYEFREDV